VEEILKLLELSVTILTKILVLQRRSHDHSLPWSTLKPLILTILTDFFASDLPVYVESQHKYHHHEHNSSGLLFFDFCLHFILHFNIYVMSWGLLIVTLEIFLCSCIPAT